MFRNPDIPISSPSSLLHCTMQRFTVADDHQVVVLIMFRLDEEAALLLAAKDE